MSEQVIGNCILFSPVGSTDPISRNTFPDGSVAHYDGSMIHICRKYKPEQVVLYLSEEMRRLEEADHRYTDSLELLGEELGCELIPSIEPGCFISENRSITEAQDYDVFYNDFEDILRTLHREYPGYELLINVSSGTPAMKTALYLLVNFLPFKTHPIQVSTPLKRSNRIEWLHSSEELHAAWSENVDSKGRVDWRCENVSYENLNVRLTKHNIRRLIDSYDYSAASLLAQEIEDYIAKEAMDYLLAAVKRTEQRWAEITDKSIIKAFGLPKSGDALCRALNEESLDGAAAKALRQAVEDANTEALESGDVNGALIEYLLWLQMKQRKGDYADFARGLTPVFFALMQLAVDELEGLHIERDGCVRRDGGTPVVDAGKIKRMTQKLLEEGVIGQELCIELREWGNKERVLNSRSYTEVICLLEKEGRSPWFEDLKKLRKIEHDIRNQAAHEIRGIDDGWIELNSKDFHYDSRRILETVKRCAGSMRDESGNRILAVDWKSYDRMNEAIKAKL